MIAQVLHDEFWRAFVCHAASLVMHQVSGIFLSTKGRLFKLNQTAQAHIRFLILTGNSRRSRRSSAARRILARFWRCVARRRLLHFEPWSSRFIAILLQMVLTYSFSPSCIPTAPTFVSTCRHGPTRRECTRPYPAPEGQRGGPARCNSYPQADLPS